MDSLLAKINLKNPKRWFNVTLMILIVLLGIFSIGYYDILAIQPYYETNELKISGILDSKVFAAGEKAWRLPVSSNIKGLDGSTVVMADANGSYQVELSIDGVIPLKKVDVEVIEPQYLLVGGQSIGILLQTNGVTVVGHSPVIMENGEGCYPAKDAGLNTGDFIQKINDQQINTNKQVSQLITEAGENGGKLVIEYTRDGVNGVATVIPEYCYDSQSYRTGLYIRDNTAGIGTLTFYDPVTKKFGALGHKISNMDSENEGDEALGSVLRADIQGIKIGQKGVPGEKLGVFIGNSLQGDIHLNTNLGIFGDLDIKPVNNFFTEPLPVADVSQVEVGPAQICTVVGGEKIDLFEIRILKIMPGYRSSGKGMVIEITDEELLSKTGGIVQGMSGSPIIQNGYIVGAISHVFINEPTKGYACFVQWMLEESSY